MPKPLSKQTIHTVHVRISGEVSVGVPASSLEEAITAARGYSFRQVVGEDFEDLSVETEVTGVFKIQ